MTWFLTTSSCMYITLSLEFIKSEKHLVPHLEDPINKKKRYIFYCGTLFISQILIKVFAKFTMTQRFYGKF